MYCASFHPTIGYFHVHSLVKLWMILNWSYHNGPGFQVSNVVVMLALIVLAIQILNGVNISLRWHQYLTSYELHLFPHPSLPWRRPVATPLPREDPTPAHPGMCASGPHPCPAGQAQRCSSCQGTSGGRIILILTYWTVMNHKIQNVVSKYLQRIPLSPVLGFWEKGVVGTKIILSGKVFE